MTNISCQSSSVGRKKPSQRLYHPMSPYGQIRLLRVQPKATCTDTVECSLETVELPTVSDLSHHSRRRDHSSRFRALSYMWGGKWQMETILVNGQNFEVRSNLYNFLRIFQCERKCVDPIWIDQVCIDQANLGERGYQVEQMRDIYEAADEVIAWLGGNNAHEAGGFKAVMRLAGSEDEILRKEKFLRPILTNPYFSRLWIVQELVLANEITVMIGNSEIAWEALILACAPHMRLCNEDDIDNRMAASGCILEQLQAARAKEPDILNAVNAFCGQKCADPRDKLYGLFGLLGRSSRGVTVVNYNIPVRQVFESFCDDILKPSGVNDFEFKTLSKLRQEMGLGPKVKLVNRLTKDPIPPRIHHPSDVEGKDSTRDAYGASCNRTLNDPAPCTANKTWHDHRGARIREKRRRRRKQKSLRKSQKSNLGPGS